MNITIEQFVEALTRAKGRFIMRNPSYTVIECNTYRQDGEELIFTVIGLFKEIQDIKKEDITIKIKELRK